ncbi:MAG: HEAT repeat domain-containing protein [Hamadaea sp.]|nr:HEAT repeat domain-containing protein [Hamadaea sp.]
MRHAYGTAEEVPALLRALGSAEPEERSEALSQFYNAVHHQGDVYQCTTATLPFLFELAADRRTPDRPAIVELLVSVGTAAVQGFAEECEPDDEYAVPDFAGSARVFRQRAEAFLRLAADPDLEVRKAAIPGLAMFVDDPSVATVAISDRLRATRDVAEQCLSVEAMATLGLRHTEQVDNSVIWLGEQAENTTLHPHTRFAALAHRARCVPERISADDVRQAIGLLRSADRDLPTQAPPDLRMSQPAGGVPPMIAFGFAELDRMQQVHAPATDLLRTFHRVLGARVEERIMLLDEQLNSRQPGTRVEALRMGGELMRSWRGDYTRLIVKIAEQLQSPHNLVVAEAAATLDDCHAVAEPAREALAQYLLRQRQTHEADPWVVPWAQLRRANQAAARTLMRLGDDRALPSVLAALDNGVDVWRAVQAIEDLPQSSGQLAQRLTKHLRRVDPAQQWAEMSTGPILRALTTLGDPTAIPALADTLRNAVRSEQWQITRSTLDTIITFGPAAALALDLIRPLTTVDDAHVPPAAVAALWAIEADAHQVLPMLLKLLDDSITFRICDAADVLGKIGPPGAAAVPRLRELLGHSYEWVQVHCATALWRVGGGAETERVLSTLLSAWTRNPATGNHVVDCLDQMGHAAAPALPLLQAQLALRQRGGHLGSIANDEQLQATCRTIIRQLRGEDQNDCLRPSTVR